MAWHRPFARLLLLAGAVATCSGQTRPAAIAAPVPAGEPPAAPEAYWLRVTADGVPLRCWADRNSVAVVRVERDTVLEALTSQFGWHRVRPPAGVFSYVAAEFVDQIAPEQGIVSVRSGTLRVRAGSLLADLDPSQSDVQTRLPRGATLRIVGRQGDWFKIVPPEGVFLHVQDEFVERISPAAAAQLRAAAAERVPVGTAGTAAAQSQPAALPDLSGAWGQRLVLAEAAIEAEARRPPLEQAWAVVMARLRPIAEQREEPMVARLAQEWLARLEQRLAAQAALRAAQSVAEREAREKTHFERELEQIQRARQHPATRPAFAAQGQLLASLAAREGEAGRRYKLQDPLSGRVVAYIEIPPDADIRVADFIGHYVGVDGTRRFDAALGADIVRISRIEIVPRDIPGSRPARRTP